MFLSCAQTLEAHRHGFLSSEEDIDDLWDTLYAKGIRIPPSSPDNQASRGNSLFGRQSPSSENARFKYLNRLIQAPSGANGHHHEIYSRIRPDDLRRRRSESPQDHHARRKRRRQADLGLYDGSNDYDDENELMDVYDLTEEGREWFRSESAMEEVRQARRRGNWVEID